MLLFKAKYHHHYTNERVSLFSIVINQDPYPTVGKFINSTGRKLKRNGIEKLGYVWVRDIGDKKFKKHFHLLLATSFMSDKKFKTLFKKKKHSEYEIQRVKTTKGIVNYLCDKELYSAGKERAYSKSRKFLLPSNAFYNTPLNNRNISKRNESPRTTR